MKTNHEWNVSACSEDNGVQYVSIIGESGSSLICVLSSDSVVSGIEHGDIMKNARLIAAAPEMRDSLDRLVDITVPAGIQTSDYACFFNELENIRKMAIHATKKAKGGHYDYRN
jgi:hypothetical protein